MGGRLEHEIRLLPQVLSCSFSQDDNVVVLIDPSDDPRTSQVAVERILHKAGSAATVHVIGPRATASAANRTISPLVVTATLATVAAIGIGALVGGFAAVEHPQSTPSHRPAPTVSASPLQFTPSQRGGQGERVTLPVETPDQLRHQKARATR